MSRTRTSGLATLVSSLALVLVGCGGDDPVNSSPDSVDATTPLEGEIVVFEAASLTDSFEQIANDFTALNPGVTVTLNPAASSALAQQIISGAPADVFASASLPTMTTVTDAGLVDGDPVVFARNRLEIAVPAGNPGGVTGLADFADPDLTIALCAEEVPCGAAAMKVFEAAGVTPAPDTLEQDVRAALSKVELGEVDAALVYRTDVIAAGDAVDGIDFPEAEDAINDYPIAVLNESANIDAAMAFVEYVLSEAGIAVLADAGFDTE